MRKKTSWILFLIVIISTMIRIYKLGSYPIHITPDEAALGYNAFTIVHTARDEHGTFLPIIFRSFDDYKPGLYVYLAVPFVAIGGVNETTVRLPSALIGALSPILIYYLILQLKRPRSQALIGAFTLALNPWHILFSRGAWESQVLIAIILTFLILLIKFTNSGVSKYAYFFSIVAALGFLTYQGAKLAIPIAAFSWIVVNPQILNLKKYFKIYFVGMCLFSVIALPVVRSFFDGRTGRLFVYSMFNYPRSYAEINQTILIPGHILENGVMYKLFQGEWLNFTRAFIWRYAHYLNPQFLFFTADTNHHLLSLPYMGNFYWWDALFIGTGLIFLARNTHDSSVRFLLMYLILAPIPAAISRDEMNAIRALPLIIPLVLFISYGGYYLYERLRNTFIWYPAIISVVTLYIFAIIYFLDIYFVFTPTQYARDQFYGYKQAVLAVQQFRQQHLPIIMAQSYAQPYIFFRFYEQTLPTSDPISIMPNAYGDVYLVSQMGDITFKKIYWPTDQTMHGYVFIADPNEDIQESELQQFPQKFSYSDILYPDQKTVAFRIVQVK